MQMILPPIVDHRSRCGKENEELPRLHAAFASCSSVSSVMLLFDTALSFIKKIACSNSLLSVPLTTMTCLVMPLTMETPPLVFLLVVSTEGEQIIPVLLLLAVFITICYTERKNERGVP